MGARTRTVSASGERAAEGGNAPVHRLRHGGLTLEGWSRAATQTYWRVPELGIGFDLGALPAGFEGTSTWAITHGHSDHLAGLQAYVGARGIARQAPPRIFVPEAIVPEVEALLALWRRLDDAPLACTVVPVRPEAEYPLGKGLVLTCFEAFHSVPAVGYVVWSRRRRLDPRYAALGADELRERRHAGEEISHQVDVPILAYTGDGDARALERTADVAAARILITEATFLGEDPPRETVRALRHVHLDDLAQRVGGLRSELIVAAHLSARYAHDEIVAAYDAALPDAVRERVVLWI